MTALIVDEPRLHAVGGRETQDWWAGFRGIALAGRVHDRRTSPDGCVLDILPTAKAGGFPPRPAPHPRKEWSVLQRQQRQG